MIEVTIFTILQQHKDFFMGVLLLLFLSFGWYSFGYWKAKYQQKKKELLK